MTTFERIDQELKKAEARYGEAVKKLEKWEEGKEIAASTIKNFYQRKTNPEEKR